ncbi:hypothetical protein [Peribacillus frigoritolerans]|uniref:hypothetical protein n=1 Tax=Peribacillus frigoritolerans TaxID=450367 RepID=UPI00207A5E36|nr:hypothetical protein [Peribacillus frigoritolerans]USK74791.1 hypothetical protein LIT31_24140 [Peribacillus frigoritolerans]
MIKFGVLQLHQFNRLEDFLQVLLDSQRIVQPLRSLPEENLNYEARSIEGFPLREPKVLRFNEKEVRYIFFSGYIETEKRIEPYDESGQLRNREERVTPFASDILVFQFENNLYAATLCGFTNGKKLMKLLFPQEQYGLIEPVDYKLTEDVLYWLFKHYIDTPDNALSENNELYVTALKSYMGKTKDNLNAVRGEGNRISTILGTLAFMFNSEQVKSLRPQMQYENESMLLEITLTGTFKLWNNTYRGRAFRTLNGKEKENALIIYAFLIILPLIVESYDESIEANEWSPQLKLDFVKRLGSEIRQRVETELQRIEHDSRREDTNEDDELIEDDLEYDLEIDDEE